MASAAKAKKRVGKSNHGKMWTGKRFLRMQDLTRGMNDAADAAIERIKRRIAL